MTAKQPTLTVSSDGTHACVEGLLLMADFAETNERCRVHLAGGATIPCSFDADLASRIQALLRQRVRVHGEAIMDPQTREFRHLRIHTIDAVTDSLGLGSEEFWHERTLDELAEEQGIAPVSPLDQMIGAGADLWDDDDDFEDFVAAIGARRLEDRR